jgi:hypothetical protein
MQDVANVVVLASPQDVAETHRRSPGDDNARFPSCLFYR